MIPTDTPSLDPLAFLKGTDQLGELIAGFDWSATSLGHIGAWPQSVKTTVSLILRSPVPIATMWGADGYLIYNSGYASIAGSRHPALLGTKVREGWPEVADFNDNVMRTVMGGGTLAYVDTEMTLQRAGRDEKTWFNLDYSPVTGEDSKPIGVIALVIETTARVRAERYQSGERDRLETMFEQAPGFMAMLTGPEHVFTLANTAYSALVGHRPVLGRSVREALPEAAQQGFVDLLDGLYRSGQAYSGTAVPWVAEATEVMPARDRFVDFVYQPLRNGAGEVFGIFVQGSDVTDRVRAEQSLRDSETTFRTLAQALPNQVWAAPPDGVPDWFNERVYAYAGMRSGDLDQGRWLGIVHPDDVAAARSAWAEANRRGEIYEIEFRLRRADGVYRWHLGRALPILDEAGAVMRWVGANTDIDDQKAAADALAYLNQISMPPSVPSIPPLPLCSAGARMRWSACHSSIWSTPATWPRHWPRWPAWARDEPPSASKTVIATAMAATASCAGRRHRTRATSMPSGATLPASVKRQQRCG
jgi:PAS domain S-box-containing protein